MNTPLSRRIQSKQPDPKHVPEWRRRAMLPPGDPERIKAKDTTSVVVA